VTNIELIKEAVSVVNYKKIDNSEFGSVGCALETDKGNLYYGVCIDTSSGMGFCAEHTAISQMITNKEFNISKIVAVKITEDQKVFILAPCGRCREFMYQINKSNMENTNIVIEENKTINLKELLPYYDYSLEFNHL